MIQRRLAQYEILQRIGQGGMGVVYRARDTHLGRTVAIKILPPLVANDPERRSRFLREAQAAANLNQSQLQELSIRLAEAGINIVKRKTGRARRLSTNLNDLRRELNRMGQRPYDDHILRLALSAINMNLNFFEEPLREVIRRQEWDQPSTMPESE